ncbi:MAG: hypothetical protein JXA77_05695 [Bacteroidales bacterium]|nr:hypothetical protein [Bacteroidales bacterium]MBN2818737.1 hypothetical protein [Bacteroidales bacterium]
MLLICTKFQLNDYKFDGTIGIWHSEEGYEFEDLNIHYGSGFHNVSVPLLVYYNKHKIEPFIRLNYNYLVSGLLKNASGTEYISDSHNIGINIGTGYSFFKNISINFEYKHKLAYDYSELISGSTDGQTIIDESRYLWNNQVAVSLMYKFNKSHE